MPSPLLLLIALTALSAIAAAQHTAQPPSKSPTQSSPPRAPSPAPAVAPSPNTDSPPPAASSFEQRLDSFDARIATIADLTADFEQTRKTALLKKPLVSRGTIYCKADTVFWRTLSPHKSDLLVTADSVTIYYPADKLAEVYPLDSRFKDAVGGPLPRLSKLRDSFDLCEIPPGEVAPGTQVDNTSHRLAVLLTPRSDELRKHIHSVRVLIDERVPCADHIVIIDPDGDETHLVCRQIKINTGLADSKLQLTFAPGTKVSHPAGMAAPAKPDRP
jgi:outer membrane lipoprotein-sorting protein